VRCALNASFQEMGYAKLLSDFPQVSWIATFIQHHRSAADHFQVGDLREIGKDFILNAVSEVSVLLIRAQALKRQHRDALLRNRLTCLPVKRKSPNDQHCNNQQQHADNDEVEDPSGDALSRSCLDRIEIFRPHNSFGGKFVNPGEEHRDWKPDRERNDNKTHSGIWNFKKREDLRRELCEEPCDDSVSDRCALNVAPLQFGEEVRWVHSEMISRYFTRSDCASFALHAAMTK